MNKRHRSMIKNKHEEKDDDVAEYMTSQSEDEYSDSEKILLQKVRRKNTDTIEESEEEVFGLRSEDSSDENDEKIADSDIEGKGDDDDDLPDVRAWGQKRKNFYRTDYVDQDYGGYDEKDLEAAEYEEQEARAIQKRLAEQLDEADFSLDIFTKESAQKVKEVEEEVIKTDLSLLSKRQKLDLLQKESPEFFGLVDDFKANMMELQHKIDPVFKLIKDGKIPASQADSYIRTKYHLILNYCTNIAFYLLLKTKRITVQSHPVVRRLYQYRQLLKQLEPVDEVMRPQIDNILQKLHSGEDFTAVGAETKTPMKKLLKVLTQLKDDKEDGEGAQPLVSDVKTEADVLEKTALPDSDGESMALEQKEEEGKRGITYQIAKNKGLTPHRKKEQRNPRVKHRNKYRKAKIRRKGQVREPRRETQRYGGEISGIKIGVAKSIKLK